MSQPESLRTVSTIVHEATHQIAFNCGLHTRLSDCPRWFSEGIAMYFESPDLRMRRGWRGIGNVNWPRLELFQQSLAGRPANSLETLLRDDKRFLDPKRALTAYAEAWALTYFLIHQHQKEYVAYLRLLSAKKPLMQDSSEERLDEFRRTFGDLAKLNAELVRYMVRRPGSRLCAARFSGKLGSCSGSAFVVLAAPPEIASLPIPPVPPLQRSRLDEPTIPCQEFPASEPPRFLEIRLDFGRRRGIGRRLVAWPQRPCRGQRPVEDWPRRLRRSRHGCGGECPGADKNCKLVAMADAFADRLQGSLETIQKQMGDKVDVPQDRRFVGLDAGDKLIQSDVDVVLLTEPPHFRAAHLKAAIEAGKHVFAEKPVAVDAPGVRSVLASAEEAKRKNLNLVAGLCWRYDSGVRETMKRVLDGAIGDITSIQETYLTGPLWHRPRQSDWTEMMYQLRNW